MWGSHEHRDPRGGEDPSTLLISGCSEEAESLNYCEVLRGSSSHPGHWSLWLKETKFMNFIHSNGKRSAWRAASTEEHQQSLTIDFVFYLLLFVQTGSQMRFWSNLCESLTSLFWSFMPGIRHNSTWRISAADGDDRTVGRACPKSSLRSEGCWPACSCHQINKMQRSELSKNCEIVIGFSIIISRSKPVATTCGYLTLRDLRAKQKEQIFFSFRDENHRGFYF